MHFYRFFSSKPYFQVCSEVRKNRPPFFSCQSLLLSTSCDVCNMLRSSDFMYVLYTVMLYVSFEINIQILKIVIEYSNILTLLNN